MIKCPSPIVMPTLNHSPNLTSKVVMALAAQSNSLAIGGSLVIPGLLIPALQEEKEENLRIGLDEGSLFGEQN